MQSTATHVCHIDGTSRGKPARSKFSKCASTFGSEEPSRTTHTVPKTFVEIGMPAGANNKFVNFMTRLLPAAGQHQEYLSNLRRQPAPAKPKNDVSNTEQLRATGGWCGDGVGPARENEKERENTDRPEPPPQAATGRHSLPRIFVKFMTRACSRHPPEILTNELGRSRLCDRSRTASLLLREAGWRERAS